MSDTRTIMDVCRGHPGIDPWEIDPVLSALGLDPDVVLDRGCDECEGTGKSPTPADWDQMAHLGSGTCQCHDSWDQCPCAEGGHPPDCDCCPGGTGLCGPLPCRTCNGTGRVEVNRVVAVPAPYDLYDDLRALRIGRAALEAARHRWSSLNAQDLLDDLLAAGDDEG